MAIAMLIAGCERGTPLAGAVVIGATPVRVAFSTSITPAGPDRAVCLVFDPPGDSQRAGQVTIVLVSARGDRDTLHGRVDRTGEATVCLRDTSAAASTHKYTQAEFSAMSALRVRQVSWGSPRIPQ